jgi:tungstate transport system ATP-binding protein
MLERTHSTILPVEGKELRVSRKGRIVLDIPAISFGKPGITVVLGPNGAGKTFLLRILSGLIKPDKGEVRWAGQTPERKRYSRFGFLLQTPVLLRRPALSNIAFAIKANGFAHGNVRKRAMLALENAGLAHLADRSAQVLSGGEKQRVALARALCLEPDILFLDEPTASLDPASTLAIEQAIANVAARGTPVVLVTHDIAQARRLASEVIFMNSGRVIEAAPGEEFFATAASAEARAYLAGKIII